MFLRIWKFHGGELSIKSVIGDETCQHIVIYNMNFIRKYLTQHIQKMQIEVNSSACPALIDAQALLIFIAIPQDELV